MNYFGGARMYGSKMQKLTKIICLAVVGLMILSALISGILMFM